MAVSISARASREPRAYAHNRSTLSRPHARLVLRHATKAAESTAGLGEKENQGASRTASLCDMAIDRHPRHGAPWKSRSHGCQFRIDRKGCYECAASSANDRKCPQAQPATSRETALPSRSSIASAAPPGSARPAQKHRHQHEHVRCDAALRRLSAISLCTARSHVGAHIRARLHRSFRGTLEHEGVGVDHAIVRVIALRLSKQLPDNFRRGAASANIGPAASASSLGSAPEFSSRPIFFASGRWRSAASFSTSPCNSPHYGTEHDA